MNQPGRPTHPLGTPLSTPKLASGEGAVRHQNLTAHAGNESTVLFLKTHDQKKALFLNWAVLRSPAKSG